MHPLSFPFFLVLLLAGALLLTACGSGQVTDPSKPHHTEDGFRNNHPHMPPQSFVKWRWQRLWSDVPPEPANNYDFERVPVDTAWLAANREATTLTWIGHATLLLQVGGVNVLTDPHLSERASPFSFIGPKRKVAPALDVSALPHIDVVLISHNHYDHLDVETVQALARQPGGPPRFFVPLGLQAWFAELGIDSVTEQDWWEFTDHLGLRVYQVPAQHFSARTPWDRNETLWGGFVVVHPELRFYFAGDTGYSPDFKAIGERLGPIDVAALPIGAYEPRWFMKAMHINPAEAVQAHQDLGARYSVAMHWGSFELTDEAIDEPPRALEQALAAAGVPRERFLVFTLGETRRLRPLLETTVAQDGQGAGSAEPAARSR